MWFLVQLSFIIWLFIADVWILSSYCILRIMQGWTTFIMMNVILGMQYAWNTIFINEFHWYIYLCGHSVWTMNLIIPVLNISSSAITHIDVM